MIVGVSRGGDGRRDAKRRGRGFPVGSLVLAVALLAAGGALALVALRGPAEPRSMDDRVRAVAASLRCPVCQNLTVADSPSRLAQEMRRTIAKDLQAGRTPEEIRRDFVGAYGQWILEAPPKRGIDLVAWIVPVLLLLGGLAAGTLAVSRWRGRGMAERASGGVGQDPAQVLTSADRSLLERALAGVEEEPE
jgi:cytochrome c-type biogenesis protein CcmH